MTAILARARFWHIVADVPINERQIKVLSLLMDDFKGNLTVARWARIAKCSHDTAAQDINDLTGRGILVRTAEGGRSTSYRLVANQCQWPPLGLAGQPSTLQSGLLLPGRRLEEVEDHARRAHRAGEDAAGLSELFGLSEQLMDALSRSSPGR